eukprot:CAMPEP_0185779156 /NCGR_PEP_ID=MMETSP1174-20130828/94873_1 /TAXON_ID=35687 /ORGANISM="Dictyocha speculum, Strain CCMP1381" /LENGTH=284 /DNA_ID=CAMNT_0028468169 /DNA_START=37 /DNA_END=891 /DNA_ORIENTATION=-
MKGTSILPAFLASIFRLGRGMRVATAAGGASRPKKPLTLYSYEGNQFCRLVREVLCELDLSYTLVNAGKGSPQRQNMIKIFGTWQCPYLVDPNSDDGIGMSESGDIIAYLYATYASWTPPNGLLHAVSTVLTPLLRPVYAVTAPLQAGKYDARAVEVNLEEEITAAPVVVFTYKLSPFCSECMQLLDNLGVEYKEVSLGWEWLPFLISEGGAGKRAFLGTSTGQTSLPHVFVSGKSVGGLFSGNPGLIPALESGELLPIRLKTRRERSSKRLIWGAATSDSAGG